MLARSGNNLTTSSLRKNRRRGRHRRKDKDDGETG